MVSRALIFLLAMAAVTGAAADDAPAVQATPTTETRFGVFFDYRGGSTSWKVDGFRLHDHYSDHIGSGGGGFLLERSGEASFRPVLLVGYDHLDAVLDARSGGPDLHVRTRGILVDYEFDFDVVRKDRFRLSLGPAVGLGVQNGRAEGWREQFGRASRRDSYTLVGVSAGGQVAAGFRASGGLEILLTAGVRYSTTVYDALGSGSLDDVDASNRAAFLRTSLLLGRRSR